MNGMDAPEGKPHAYSVLALADGGSLSRIRTYGHSINSRMLYR